jgi:hypothetical protein
MNMSVALRYSLATVFMISTMGSTQTLAEKKAHRAMQEKRQIKEGFGACVIRRHGYRAREFVRRAPGQEMTSNLKRVIDGDCLILAAEKARSKYQHGAMMIFPASTYHNMLAEALVRVDYPVHQALDFSIVPPLAHAELAPADSFTTTAKGKRAEEERESWETARYDSIVSRIGECAVRANPAAAHALVMAEPGSQSERAAAVAIRPALGGCIGQGSTVKLNIEYIRGVLARSYWRLADLVAPVTQRSS